MKNLLLSLLAVFQLTLFGQNYDIYVSDAGNFSNPPWQIIKYDQNGQNPSVFIGNNLNWPQDILFLEDSNTVLISNLGSGRITRHNASDGSFISDFATGIAGPTRIKIGPDSLLYVLQWQGQGLVRRYDLAGNYLGDFTSVGVTQSIGIDWDRHGNLYVSSYNGDLVRKFDTAGADMGIFIDSSLVGPTNIWFDQNGDLLVADYDGTAVKRFDSTGNYLSDFMVGLKNCEGVAILPNGDILIGNGQTRSVKLFDNQGVYQQDLITPGSGNLRNPNAVVIRTFSNVSLPEVKRSEKPFMYPSTGTRFEVDSQYHNLIEHFEVYDMFGALVNKEDSGYSWNAENMASGVYIVVANFKDGSRQSQELTVVK